MVGISTWFFQKDAKSTVVDKVDLCEQASSNISKHESSTKKSDDRCYCGLMHVRTGALLILWTSIVMSMLALMVLSGALALTLFGALGEVTGTFYCRYYDRYPGPDPGPYRIYPSSWDAVLKYYSVGLGVCLCVVLFELFLSIKALIAVHRRSATTLHCYLVWRYLGICMGLLLVTAAFLTEIQYGMYGMTLTLVPLVLLEIYHVKIVYRNKKMITEEKANEKAATQKLSGVRVWSVELSPERVSNFGQTNQRC